MELDPKDQRRDPDLRDVSVEDIAFYYDEMVRSNLVELEVETPKGKLILKRRQIEKELPKSVQFRRKTDSAAAAPQKAEDVPVSSAKIIASPIMGTFYRSSSPQTPPFVKEGDTVNAGATLCIVEAMKVMNEIKAEARCRIVKILGENGKPISKGQPLFHYEPA